MRKGMAQGLARPAYFDRNPITRAQSYSVNAVAPHGSTTRWTYTVPAGKKAQIDHAFGLTMRDAAAGAAGYAYGFIAYTASGQAQLLLIIVMVLNVAIGTSQQIALGALGLLQAGDVIIGATSDASTGGSLYYNLAMKYTEFDA